MTEFSDAWVGSDDFVRRHIGPSASEQQAMLDELKYKTLDQFIDATVPKSIRCKVPFKTQAPMTETAATKKLKGLAQQNQLFKSYIGLGYHDTLVPKVVQRNVFENPGWYTQYTPYQSEIAQGRLEALLNYQTMVCDLTGLEISNASLLDEATAAAEAMSMSFGFKKPDQNPVFLVSNQCHPQTIAVVQTRAEPLGITVEVGPHSEFDFSKKPFGILLQYPGTNGHVEDFTDLATKAHEGDALVTLAADILSLLLLKSPGEMGADIAVGSTQRFGVPMGFGGPHAGYFATKDQFKRKVPGRIIGVSKDREDRMAYRMALQTREQHIRRDKATSNICTSQVLLAIMASMYAVYHGPKGLTKIAMKVHGMTCILATGLKRLGIEVVNEHFFDTLCVVPKDANAIRTAAESAQINFRYDQDGRISIALDEATEFGDLDQIFEVFAAGRPFDKASTLKDTIVTSFGETMARSQKPLTHPVFNSHHSESKMLRYIRTLESRDLSLTRSMIPLGSCTMKLNAASELYPVSWNEFAGMHPFAPAEQTQGYLGLFKALESELAACTGFDAISLQPNSGAQGEFSGLLVIRQYHKSRGEGHRNVCLIPKSAHGTNPASAVLTGMKVVVVACGDNGDIDVEDMRAKAAEHKDNLAALMVTYPSTHGVFEESISEICQIVHDHGGQVYMDGANMNAQIGLCKPGEYGPDVCHLNLHKTFSIPHGGGGPGMGPIGVKSHLTPHLPGHVFGLKESKDSCGPVSAAPWGSASILPISLMYCWMMGDTGLTDATKVAILNANYIAKRLDDHYPVLYRGLSGLVAHECIVDLRPIKAKTGIDVEDVAKRLMDYGFHAPTVSFPVPGTMMIEPTESEGKDELDRFCDAMIKIRQEIAQIEEGKADKKDNLLKNAPHTSYSLTGEWSHPYSKEQAVFPTSWVKSNKFWPSVARIDNAFGDRNLICSCPSIEEYQ
jgi:glycine dehydrogenase